MISRSVRLSRRMSSRLAVGDRPHAVPLELEGPAVLFTGERGQDRQHRLDVTGHRLVVRIRRWIHPVDHPVVPVGLKQGVLALHPLAGEGGDHLVVPELLGLERPPVPDLDGPAAVLALGDLALEFQVLERMGLGADGQAVVLRVLRHAPGKRPRGERAVVLEPQVPMKPTRVVLLDHEAIALGLRLPALAAARFRGLVERALALVVGGLSRRHRIHGRRGRRPRSPPARPGVSRWVGRAGGDPGCRRSQTWSGAGGPKLGVIARSSAPARRMCRYQR